MPKPFTSTVRPHVPAPARTPPSVPTGGPGSVEHQEGRPHNDTGHRNEVVLAGRVTAEPAVRELPSGDHLVTWRISVTRPPAEQRPNQPADPITCVSFHPSIEEATRGWRIGDVVQVSGSLRRRFWRSPNGSTSVIEVAARKAHRVARKSAEGCDQNGSSASHQPS